MSKTQLQRELTAGAFIGTVAVARPDLEVDQDDALDIMQARYDEGLTDRNRAMMSEGIKIR